jgi:aryl-alcohol dehydrogenase-like predicted oxidoreductase
MSHFYRIAQGMRMSSLGIGTYLGAMDDATDEAYVRAIGTAIDGGVNLIDTSRNYRAERSERCVGRAIQGRDRDGLVLCTKAGYRIDRNGHSLDPEFLRENLEASLENLGVDQIDVFYLHNPETQSNAPDFAKQMHRAIAACEGFCAAGLIRFYGTATWNGYRTADNPLRLEEYVQCARGEAGTAHRFRFVQLPFNLAMHEAMSVRNQPGGESTLQAAGRLGVSVVGSATVLQGRLTRGLPETLADKFGGLATDAQRSIQFSRSTPGIAAALVGMSSEAHVAENLAVKDVAPLSEQDYYALYAK